MTYPGEDTIYGGDVPTWLPDDELPLPPGVVVADPWIRLGSAFIKVVLIILTLGIGWIIWSLIVVEHGQTAEKAVMNLRVIDATSLKPVGFVEMFFLRHIVGDLVFGFAIFFTLGILMFMPFWDHHNQNLWDKLSNTYVVLDPNDAWGTKSDLSR